MKIYDIDTLKEGTDIVAQRDIPGPQRRYDKGTVFKYRHIVRKLPDGYATISVAIGGRKFETYDDYFKLDTDMSQYIVTILRCVFDET